MLQNSVKHPAETGELLNDRNEVAHLLETHYDTIVEIENAWRTVDNTVSQLLDEQHVDHVLELIEAAADTEVIVDSRAQKREVATIKQNARETINATIIFGKWNAQLFVLGDAELKKEILEMHESGRSELANDPYDIHFSKILEDITHAYVQAYTAEQTIIDPLFELFDEDAERLENLADILTDESTALDEYTGLLMAIARTHYDPEEQSLIDTAIETLQDYPDYHASAFMTSTMNTLRAYNRTDEEQDIEALSDTERWVQLFGNFVVKHSLDTRQATEFLETVDYFALPRNTQDEIKHDLKEHLEQLRATFVEILEPFKKPRRFLERNEPAYRTSTPSTKKRNNRQRSGGRTTPKSTHKRNVCASEQELSQRPIESIVLAKETPQGHDGRQVVYSAKEAESSAWNENAVGAILELKTFKEYTAKYQNTEDVRKMLQIIIEHPKGKGSTIMSGQKISLIDPKNATRAKKRQVHHFSPQDCAGIGLSDSPESNRTRIFYCVADGQLVLLDIQHKTTAERQKGKFRKN